ncbi:hypothetical protein ALO62_200141 [Pseudomonas amygdali pv. myricae]|nr:hypothetical protein ALO62_200141 [Pseudomonas amygdali pv. myricae]
MTPVVFTQQVSVFGRCAALLPENNCLASTCTSTGFPPMTEFLAVPAYNPSQPHRRQTAAGNGYRL